MPPLTKLLFVMLIAASTLVACAQYTPPAGTEWKFTTRITDINLKHFELRLTSNKYVYADPFELLEVQQKRKLASRTGREIRLIDNIRKHLVNQLEPTLAENGFCREGYWIIDNNAYASEPYIRGECNETATPEDIRDFPNTLTNW